MRDVKISILGCSLENDNRGVSALAYSLLNLFAITIPKRNIILNYIVPGINNTERNISINNKRIKINKIVYKVNPKYINKPNLLWLTLFSIISWVVISPVLRRKLLKKNRFLSRIINTDLVCDIFGGDSFSDIYGFIKFIKNAWLRLLIISIGKEIIFLPQTYGPYYSKFTKLIVKLLLKKSNIILSRDKDSIDLIEKLYLSDANRIRFCPDVAFTLPVEKIYNKPFECFLKNNSKHIIVGINISGLLYYSKENMPNKVNLKCNYSEMVLGIIKNILSFKDVGVLIIPHVFNYEHQTIRLENDYSASIEIRNKLSLNIQKKVFIVNGKYNQNQLKYIIGKCDYFLGSRMHACIAALSQGIPTIGLAYSKKFIGVFNSVGFEDSVIDMTKEVTDSAIEKSIQIINQGKESVDLRKKVLDVQNNIRNTFREIIVKVL